MTRRIKRDPKGRKRQPTTRVKYSDAPLPRPAHSRPALRVVDSDTVFLPGRDRDQPTRHSCRQKRWTISRPSPGILMDSSRSSPTSFSPRNDLFRDRHIASRKPVLWGRVSNAHFRKSERATAESHDDDQARCISRIDHVLQRECRENNQTADEIFVRSECSPESRIHMRSR